MSSTQGHRALLAPSSGPMPLSLSKPPAPAEPQARPEAAPPWQLPQPQLIRPEKPALVQGELHPRLLFLLLPTSLVKVQPLQLPGPCGVINTPSLGTPRQAEG